MTSITFTRRRQRLRARRQTLKNHQLQLHMTMKTLFRILTALALIIGGLLAAVQYLALVPPGTIPADWIIKAGIVAALLKGALEGLTVIGDLADDGVRNGSFDIGKLQTKRPADDGTTTRVLCALLFVGIIGYMLTGCSSASQKAFEDRFKTALESVAKASSATALEGTLNWLRAEREALLQKPADEDVTQQLLDQNRLAALSAAIAQGEKTLAALRQPGKQPVNVNP